MNGNPKQDPENARIRPNVLHTAQMITAFLDRHGVEHLVVGGLAVKLHGGARDTKDVDISVASFDPELREALRAELGFDVQQHPGAISKPDIWLVTAPPCTVSRSCALSLLAEASSYLDPSALPPTATPARSLSLFLPPASIIPSQNVNDEDACHDGACKCSVDLPRTTIDIAVRAPFVNRTKNWRNTLAGVSGTADPQLLIANKVHTVVDRAQDEDLPKKVSIDVEDLMTLGVAREVDSEDVGEPGSGGVSVRYPAVMTEVLTEKVWETFFERAARYSTYSCNEIQKHLRDCGLSWPEDAVHGHSPPFRSKI
ncbi:hypothetical protein HGRIS_006344 [Hohenbuehelia grisea]|uniref:Uncharacterized protein n=1 Tax=Hohenbuehelia grisea TaxID=104357 RepID=A0ABR3K2G4_9AGAR